MFFVRNGCRSFTMSPIDMNEYFHKCQHDRLSPEQQRKKKWLKPGSAPHTALVKIAKDKRLLKDLEHLVQFVHTTALEVYHSLYLKYLPKLTHFTHDIMKVGTMLAALDPTRSLPQMKDYPSLSLCLK